MDNFPVISGMPITYTSTDLQNKNKMNWRDSNLIHLLSDTMYTFLYLLTSYWEGNVTMQTVHISKLKLNGARNQSYNY